MQEGKDPKNPYSQLEANLIQFPRAGESSVVNCGFQSPGLASHVV